MTIYRPIIALDILSVVLNHYKITIEDMHSDRRTSEHYDITSAREAFAWLCRKYTKTSYPDIAEVGLPGGVDELKALGNAQVPQCVEVISCGMIDAMNRIEVPA